MAFQELTQYNSPNYTPESQVPAVYGMPRTIEGVTYHWWGDPRQNPKFISIVSYLCRPNGDTSAHVVGEAGRVAWIVDARHAAWHAGNARGNATTVGYECNPRLSDGDYETMGEFHYDMEKTYGRRLSIYVHKEWSATTCSPIDKGRIRAIADRYHAGGAPKPQPAPDWAPMANPRRMRAATDLSIIDLNKNKAIGNMIKAGTDIEFVTQKNQNGTTYLRSRYSTDKNLNQGVDIRSLIEVPAPTPTPAPEPPKPAPAPSPTDVLANEHKELEKRVTALEKAVQMLKDFLAKLFNGFNK